MKKLFFSLVTLLLGYTSFGQEPNQACWVSTSETTCASSVSESLQIGCLVNTPSTGYYNYWRVRSTLSPGGASVISSSSTYVGTASANYWFSEFHNYTITASGTYTAVIDVQCSNDNVHWTTSYTYYGGGDTRALWCVTPLRVTLQKDNSNFHFYVNGKTYSGNGSDPIDIIRCPGQDIQLDAITGTGAIDHIETQLSSGLYEPMGGFAAVLTSPYINIGSGIHPVSLTDFGGYGFGAFFTYFYPGYTYITVTVKVYGPCDLSPVTKTITYRITDANAYVNFTMQGPLDRFGNGCTSAQPINPTPTFASFTQPVSAPPCYTGWLSPNSVNVVGAVPYVTGTGYNGYQYLVERVSPSATVLGTASSLTGTLPAFQNLNTVTGNYFITNYSTIKNNEVFKVTATIYTDDCGPVGAESYFMIIDGGTDGATWKLAPENTALVNSAVVFPNPATDRIHIGWNKGIASGKDAEVLLKDVLGKTVLQQSFTEADGMNDHVVDLTTIPAGVYFYTLRTAGGNYSGKIIKQ